MDNPTKALLTRAYNTKSLCALHIDLQACFYCEAIPHEKQAFTNTAHLSKSLRPLNIENVWAVCSPQYKIPIKAKFFIPGIAESNFAVVSPDKNEWVLPKNNNNLFCEKDKKAYQPLLPETILTDGIHFDQCVTDTIVGAFQHRSKINKPLNIVLLTDCTDSSASAEQKISYIKKALKKAHPEINIETNTNLNLTHANSNERIELFKQLALAA